MTKKNIRMLLLGLGLILLLGGSYAGISIYTSREEEKKTKEQEQSEQDAVILALDPEKIVELSIEKDGETLAFQKENGTWIYPEDPEFRMNAARMNQMLDDLSELKATRTLEAQGDPEQFGLGASAGKITAVDEDGKQTTLLYGERNTSTHDLYVQLGGASDVVYMTAAALERHFGGKVEDYAQYESFPKVSPEMMRIFRVEKEDPYVLDMPGDSNCTVADDSGEKQAANLNLVGILQVNLSNSDWADNISYHCTDLSLYGLDEPEAVIHVTYEEDKGEGSFDLSVGDLDEKGNYYVRLDDSLQVHTIRSEYLDDFVKSTASTFWSLAYSFVSIGDLDHMTVTVEGKAGEITHSETAEGQNNTQVEWLLDGKKIETESFTDFYYSCVAVTAQERLEEVPELSEEPVLELKYYLNDGSEKLIRYYREDQNFYTVLYENGTKAAHTNKLYVNEMIEKFNALLKE